LADKTFNELYASWFLPIESFEQKKRTIIIGGDSNYPPYEFIDSKGKPAGYNVELSQAIADALGLVVEFKLGPWSEILQELKNNNIDIIHGMFYSVERNREFDFSPAHTSIGHVIITNDKTVDYSNLDLSTLRGKKIVVMKGDISHDTAVQAGYQNQLIFTKTQEAAVKLIAKNQYQYAIVARTPALYWINKYGYKNVFVSRKSILTPDYCYASQKNNVELLNSFTEGLKVLKNNGKYHKIYSKWLGIYDQNEFDLVTIIKYSLFIIIPILLITFAFILWSYLLKKQVTQRTAELQKEIHERIYIEEMLRNEKEHLSTTLRSIGDGVITTDTFGTIIMMNRVAEELTGYTLDTCKGFTFNTIFKLKNEDGRQISDNAVEKVLNTGKIFEPGNHALLIAKDGSERAISETSSPIRDAKGNISGVIVVFRDMTEKLKLLETIQHSSRLKSLGVLAGGIAHDFNNILGAIIGYADLSFDLIEKGSVLENNIHQIVNAGERAKLLIRQILSFSRQTNEDLQLLFLKPIIEEAIQLMTASLPSSIRITSYLYPESFPIMADSTKIHEIIMNLITNAAYALNDKGTIEISLEETHLTDSLNGRTGISAPGNYSIITVKDSGHGMDNEVLMKIFEPYFTTKPVGDGSGMGLSTVFGIVSNHGGNITVESFPGKGSTFKVYLPKARNEVPKTKEAHFNARGGNERILYIDDEEALCSISKVILSNAGYFVTTFSDSTKALEAFKTSPQIFDLVITDQTMPGITGCDLSKEILEIRNDIPIILCTGYSKTVDESIVSYAGIKFFCMKPLRKNDLLSKVRETLDNYRADI
jgi:two-component system sensor histidine kinase EvgS